MFYESLEKTAKKKKKRRKTQPKSLAISTTDLGLGAGVALGTSTAGGMLQGVSGRKMLAEIEKDRGSGAYEKLKAAMGATTSGDDLEFGGKTLPGGAIKTKDGKKFFFTEDAGKVLGDRRYDTNAFFADAPTKKHQRGIIGLGKNMHDSDVLLHELGHGTGLGRKLQQNTPARIAYGLSRLAAPISLAGNIGAGALAFNAKNEKDLDRASKVNRAAGLVSAFHALPTLAEEARASIRARGLAKKFNHKLNTGKLLGAYGTYAGSLAPALAPYAINKYMINKKRKALQEKKAGADFTVRNHMHNTLKLLKKKRAGSLNKLEQATLRKQLRNTVIGGAAGATTLGGILAYDKKQRSK